MTRIALAAALVVLSWGAEAKDCKSWVGSGWQCGYESNEDAHWKKMPNGDMCSTYLSVCRSTSGNYFVPPTFRVEDDLSQENFNPSDFQACGTHAPGIPDCPASEKSAEVKHALAICARHFHHAEPDAGPAFYDEPFSEPCLKLRFPHDDAADLAEVKRAAGER